MRYDDIDLYAVMQRIPEITGLELEWRNGSWEGRYYITGERHAYKRDKLRIKLWKGERGCSVWLHEQGGESMSLQTWLQRYGGAADWKEAMDIMRGHSRPLPFVLPMSVRSGAEACHVGAEEHLKFANMELTRCPLFRRMCALFGQKRVTEVWRRYGATTDMAGDAVYWYYNAEGKICHDKIIRYGADGRRDRTFGGSRLYTTAKGYTERCLYGSNLIRGGEPFFVVEGEKSALIAACAYPGRVWVASGGKNTLRDMDSRAVLFPDIDAYEDWERYGRCVRWWDGWDSAGDKSDIADMIVDFMENGKSLPDIDLLMEK